MKNIFFGFVCFVFGWIIIGTLYENCVPDSYANITVAKTYARIMYPDLDIIVSAEVLERRYFPVGYELIQVKLKSSSNNYEAAPYFPVYNSITIENQLIWLLSE